MLADELDYVVGVDTHRDQHVLAIVAAPSGAVIAQRSISAEARGYAEALRFADRHAPGVRVWAIGGTRRLRLRARPIPRPAPRAAPRGEPYKPG